MLIKPLVCQSRAWNDPRNNTWQPSLINSHPRVKYAVGGYHEVKQRHTCNVNTDNVTYNKYIILHEPQATARHTCNIITDNVTYNIYRYTACSTALQYIGGIQIVRGWGQWRSSHESDRHARWFELKNKQPQTSFPPTERPPSWLDLHVNL